MLNIEISKRPDGGGVLSCTRADGSRTWQKQKTLQAPHFALHDLTHFAVESVLGYRRGFFGLIAAGWEIEDTQGKGSRGPLPGEALEVERLVGLFDTERASGTLWTADQFNETSPRPLTDDAIHSVRARRAELFRMWGAVVPGGKLGLTFATGAADPPTPPVATVSRPKSTG